MASSSAPPPSLRPPKGAMPLAEGPLPPLTHDVAIVGGGINGTGVARDLALRGLRVVLYERNDLAFGASGNSSGMIHGGVRYLTKNPHVTEQSCRDSGYIQQIAPNLLFRIPFIMPIKAGPRGRIALELVDAFFRLYDQYQPLKRGEPHTRLSTSDLAALEPGIVGSFVGGITFDEWGVDGARLCVLNAIDAKEHGADVFPHTAVERIERSPDGQGYVISARDLGKDCPRRSRARLVVNATGAWSPVTASLGRLPTNRVAIRPGKGIHVGFDRRLSNYGVVCEAIDGRQIFVMPWQNMTVIGTTDDDYYGDLNDVRSTSEEVRYLVQGVARVFPQIRQARAITTWAGVRATIYEYGKNEDELSREHAIVDHTEDGAPGIFSMIGGKLASFRIFAEEMSDRIARDLAPGTRSTTHERPLPGGESVPDAIALSTELSITPVAARRLVYRHGNRAKVIAKRLTERPTERTTVCPCEPVIEAEIRHVVRHELASSVDDVARRTRLGLGACGGMRCAARCGQIVAEELGLPAREGLAQARKFILRQARMRMVAMGPDQARQEALLLAHLQSSLGAEETG